METIGPEPTAQLAELTAATASVVSAGPDAANGQVQVPWLVPGFVGPGLTVIAGPARSGKSWLALNLAVAVATGTKAFGVIPCEQGSVLYVDGENGEARMEARLAALTPDDVCLPPDRPAPLEMDCWPFVPSGLRSQISDAYPESSDVRLLVIDSPQSVGPAHPSASLQSRNLRVSEIAELQSLVATSRLAILLVVRTAGRRDDLDRILALADTTLVLEPSPSGAILTVRSRDAVPRKLALAFDGCRWSITGEAEARRASPQRLNIVALLAVVGTGTPAEISGALGEPVVNIKRMLVRMLRAGDVARVRHGLYRLPSREADGMGVVRAARSPSPEHQQNQTAD